jgi:hypothetical protein
MTPAPTRVSPWKTTLATMLFLWSSQSHGWRVWTLSPVAEPYTWTHLSFLFFPFSYIHSSPCGSHDRHKPKHCLNTVQTLINCEETCYCFSFSTSTCHVFSRMNIQYNWIASLELLVFDKWHSYSSPFLTHLFTESHILTNSLCYSCESRKLVW